MKIPSSEGGGLVFVNRLKEEQGTILLQTLFIMICLFGFLGLLLFMEQASLMKMQVQQTADVITKGARAAGSAEYTDSMGTTHKLLVATDREAAQRKLNIVRGAREEADILYSLNKKTLQTSAESVSVVHQKGEQRSLYDQGIYHLALTVEKRAALVWDSFLMTIRRTSQSGVY